MNQIIRLESAGQNAWLFIEWPRPYFFFLLILVLCIKSAALAQMYGEVRVGETVVFRFYEDGVYDPVQRAQEVQNRIEALLDSGLTADDVRIEKEGSLYVIYWGSDSITQVDANQAALNKTKPEALSRVWANNLKNALSKNIFYLVPGSLTMMNGSTAVVKPSGILKGRITKEYDEGNVHVTIDQDKEEITILATGIGQSKVVFERAGAKAVLNIRIRDLAAEVPKDMEVQVSGNPAPDNVLQFVAHNLVKTRVKPKPGATLEIYGPVRVPAVLERGKSTTAYVPIKVTGKDYIPLKTDVPVTISNTGPGFSKVKTVMVSNRPESTDTDGILFKENFNFDQPTRFLYYHKNGSRENRVFWIELKNNSSETIKVLTCGALAGPSRWGVNVGHMAAMRFLETNKDGVSYCLEIAPGKTLCLLDIDIPQEQVICGYMHLEIVQGKELEIMAKNSIGYKKEGDSLPVLYQPFDPFRIHPKGIFSPADIYDEVTYTVGQEEEAACNIGLAPWLIDPVTGEPNNGNYGVFYNFKLKLKNPTNEKKLIGFYLVPDNVLARGSFIMQGKLMETGIARNPGRLIFAVQDLLPGEEKEVTLITTPEGGSYYPTKVVVIAVDESEAIQINNKKPEIMMDLPDPNEDKD